MKTFLQVLANNLIAGITVNFVWFAIVFWAFDETRTVLATSIVGGIYLAATAICGFWFGSVVDNNKKKIAMLVSSLATLVLFSAGLAYFTSVPTEVFKNVYGANFWILVLILLFGVIAGGIRNIALPTTVTLLVREKDRDKANGMSGTMMGISFLITSALSGVVLTHWGMSGVILISIALTVLTIIHLLFVPIPEKKIVKTGTQPPLIDVRGTIAAIATVPGLFALIFFTTFNNFLGGVFMSLMDAYGLTLVSKANWGYLLAMVSPGFILGGLFIAKKGLGKNPLKTLFLVNIILWIVCIFFTIQPWIALLLVGMFIWMFLVPFVEAVEQTIIQKVIPFERQGRVFGFAHTVEQAASPLTAFMIGPIAQFIFIPFMTTGRGVELIGSWFGVGLGRGIALVFIATGILGLIITLIAMRSNSYKLLSERFQK